MGKVVEVVGVKQGILVLNDAGLHRLDAVDNSWELSTIL